jgi:hypothetical protein
VRTYLLVFVLESLGPMSNGHNCLLRQGPLPRMAAHISRGMLLIALLVPATIPAFSQDERKTETIMMESYLLYCSPVSQPRRRMKRSRTTVRASIAVSVVAKIWEDSRFFFFSRFATSEPLPR